MPDTTPLKYFILDLDQLIDLVNTKTVSIRRFCHGKRIHAFIGKQLRIALVKGELPIYQLDLKLPSGMFKTTYIPELEEIRITIDE